MYIKKSLKFNVIARSIVGFVELAFSLFCFPYVASKLDPANLGQIDFVNSTVTYFVTLSAFGITEFGGREVAQLRNSREKVDDILKKLFQISLLISFILFVFYLGIVVPFFGNGSRLFVYSSFLIMTTSFNLIWALEGLEDFVFIAYAKVISKICFFAYILTLVKGPGDTGKYFLGMMLFDFLYFLFSFFRLKFRYGFSFSFKDIFQKPAFSIIPGLFQIFIMILIQSSIAGIPSIFMGKLKLLTELGQLAVAQRFFWVGYYAVIPLATVLLSRSMSFSIDNDSNDRKIHLDLAALSMITFCLPIAAGIFLIAGDVVPLFLGQKYHDSIILLRSLAPMIVILSVINFWSMQVVFSYKGEKSLIKANLLGLLMMVISSLIFIPKFAALGGVIAMSFTYSVLLVVFYLLGRKYYRMNNIINDLMKAVAATAMMIISLWYFNAGTYYFLPVKIIAGALVYFIVLIALKQSLAIRFFKYGLSLIKR